MSYLITCIYRPGGEQERMPLRDVHLEYIIENLNRIDYAGALTDDGDHRAIGMFIALATDDRSVALSFMDQEPYTSFGLFESVTYQRLRKFIPNENPRFLNEELVRERQRLGKGG